MNQSLILFFTENLDLYCERLSTGWFAEPLNLASNLAYIAFALLAYPLWKRECDTRKRKELRILLCSLASIGLGSAWFHSSATRLSQIGDILPIALFVFLSLYYYFQAMKREGFALTKLTLSILPALILPPLFAKLSGLSLYLAKGDAYLGIVPSLLILSLQERSLARKKILALNSGLFTLALVFRTLDTPICDIFPSGTHFLWHLTTALAAYLMVRAYALPSRDI